MHSIPTPTEWAQTQKISPILLDTLYRLFEDYPMGAHAHLGRYLIQMRESLGPAADYNGLRTEVTAMVAVANCWGIYGIKKVLPSISTWTHEEPYRPQQISLNMLLSRWIAPRGYEDDRSLRELRLRTPNGRESILARFVILASIGRLDGDEEERTRFDRVGRLLEEGMRFEQIPLEIVERMDPRLYLEAPGHRGWEAWKYIRHLEQTRPNMTTQSERIERLQEFLASLNVRLTFTPC